MARCGQVSSTPLFRSAARGSDRTTITSASALPTYRRAGQVALLQLDLCRCATLVTVQLDMVPLSTTKSLRIVKRSLPNGHTHQTYDWGRSNAKFRMQKCAWCHHFIRRSYSKFWVHLVIFGTEKRRFFVCSHTPTHMTSMAGRATRIYAKIGSPRGQTCGSAFKSFTLKISPLAARKRDATQKPRIVGPLAGVCKAACTHVHHRPS